ncbi:hypothetical protein DPMN_139218 [Dreissena polymorpha]|uniref:Uncharacterized protein n=1 Tax=Dreissena polymorpha TaxID=45954 RepID=A0A9D4G5B1_DREPO|nr:hypothetical protein DPMN_139218 [Dreissena polymorpha]
MVTGPTRWDPFSTVRIASRRPAPSSPRSEHVALGTGKTFFTKVGACNFGDSKTFIMVGACHFGDRLDLHQGWGV